MIRVAFTALGGVQWTGGHNYLLNLLTALVRYQSATLKPILFIGSTAQSIEIEQFQALEGIEVVLTEAVDSKRQIRSLVQAVVLGRDLALRKLLVQNRIDLIFEAAQFYGRRLGIPAIAWIPDFQHRAMPTLFSMRAWLRREFGFRAQIVGGRTIMLSSDDARAACEFYYPSTRKRTRTVRFATSAGLIVTLEQAREIARSYGLPERFFFLPNQFWKHKNHGIVIDALKILNERGVRLVVAASGRQHDPRHPDYFASLQQKVDALSLGEQFRFLGMLPYAHIPALMRACEALINPSLFEGWSTTVEEARSLGVPMILSDLETHYEQVGVDARYFQRASAESLANILEEVSESTDTAREEKYSRARTDAECRFEHYAKEFYELVRACCNGYSPA